MRFHVSISGIQLYGQHGSSGIANTVKDLPIVAETQSIMFDASGVIFYLILARDRMCDLYSD